MKTLPAFLFTTIALGAAYASACSSTPSGTGPGNPNGGAGGSGSSSGGQTMTLEDGAVVVTSSSGGSGSSSGSSGGSGSGGSTAPLPAQCTDLATATCAQMAKCDTLDMEQAFGNDMAKCAARLLFSCPSVTEPGTSTTPTTIEACASAIGQLSSCNAYFGYINANNGLLCPTPAGSLANGAGCLDDSQCKGGYCGAAAPVDAGTADGGASTSSCGACANKPPPTSCQENSNCPSGQLCNANGTCVAPGAAGATCDDSDPFNATQPCNAGMYCLGVAVSADGGTTNGVCTALGTAGKACNAGDDVNDCADGLFCNGQGVCAAIKYVALGGICDDYGLVCTGAECVFPNTADASATGTCTAYAADGASCQSDQDCLFNAFCSTAGKCSTASPTCN